MQIMMRIPKGCNWIPHGCNWIPCGRNWIMRIIWALFKPWNLPIDAAAIVNADDDVAAGLAN